MKNEWVMVNKKIVKHWLWEDAERLKWWLDLLIMAASEDMDVMSDAKQVHITKGQILASVSYLSRRWSRSAPTIIKFLKMLERDKMISRDVVGRNTAIITILNTAERPEHVCEHKHIDAPNKTQQTAENEEKTVLLGDSIWREAIMMKFGMDEATLDSRLSDFYTSQKCLGNDVVHASISDAKRHFTSWLAKTRTNYETTTRTNNKRTSTEATATRAEDYKGGF